jgi:hypothetical protein
MARMPFSPQLNAIYTLQYAGFKAVFNDPFDPDYAGMLTEVSGLDSPDIRESAEDLVESDGGVHGNFYFGRRPVTLSGRIFGHATAADRDRRLDLVRNASMALRSDAVLSWEPHDRIANLVMNPRGADGTTTSWSTSAQSGSSAALAVNTSSYSGIQMTATLNTAGHWASMHQDPYSYVDPRGTTVYPSAITTTSPKYVTGRAVVSVVSAPASSNAVISLRLRCFDSSGVWLAEHTLDSFVLSGTSAAPLTLDGAVAGSALPANTARVSLQITISGNATTGSFVLRADQLAYDVRRDNVVMPYVDGVTGAWWGAANSSASGDFIPMEISLRRQQPLRIAGPWVKDFQLQMVAADPLIISPIERATTIAIGSFAALENAGNADYYPQVDVYGPLNQWSTISGGGDDLQIINPTYAASGFTSAIKYGTLDMLRHTFTEPDGDNFNMHVNWVASAEWPKVPANGGTWTLTNGVTGTNTGGYIIVKHRDAWE